MAHVVLIFSAAARFIARRVELLVINTLLIFCVQAFAESFREIEMPFKEQRLEEQRRIIQSFQDKGTKPEIVNSIKQYFDLENRGIEIKTWQNWTNQYKAQILEPPVRFDLLDHFEPDFSTPVSACRSFNHAMRIGDAETLIKNSDESGRAWLKETGIRAGAKAENYYTRTGLKQSTIARFY